MKGISLSGAYKLDPFSQIQLLGLTYWQAIKSSVRVYLEAYTSILMIEKERLVRNP